MKRLAFLLAAAIGLSLVVPATAAPPLVTIDEPEGGFFQVQAKPFKAGDRWRYVSETESTEEGGAHPGGQTNRMVFDLEIVRMEGAQPVFRYTLRELSLVDERQPGALEMLSAFIGVPVEFRTVNGIYAGETLNGEEIRRQALANLKGPADLRKILEGVLDERSRESDGLSTWLAGDVANLAGMHLPRIPMKPYTLPTQTRALEDGATLVTDASMQLDTVDDARCQVGYHRESRFVIKAKGYDERLKTQAVLASDAMPVSLSQTQTKTAPDGYAFRETLTITRQSAAPGCG